MKTRTKLRNAITHLSGFEQLFALALYDEHGPAHAYAYVNQVEIDKKLEAYR